MTDIKELNNIVATSFAHFGETKQIQIARLLYEITKRDGFKARDIIDQMPTSGLNFHDVKKALVSRRYPTLSKVYPAKDFYLGKVDIDPDLKADVSKRTLSPANIYIEKEVETSDLAKRVKQHFPQAKTHVIDQYNQFIQNKSYSIKDYNNRLDHFYIVREKYDFFKNCPCSPHTVACGLHIVNLGSGCAFDCSYCYLQGFINAPGIVLPGNIDDFFEEFKKYRQDIRIGSGEYSDSLVFDHITEYSPKIVEFFRGYPRSQFEFKTKSVNIDNLFKVKAAANIVIAWSINTSRITNSIEHFTASFDERIAAAVKCAQAGYSVGFHFDPIFQYEGAEKEYKRIIDTIYKNISPKSIAWLSLGTLRMTNSLRKAIENRFPDNTILDEEMILGHDQKIRYDHRTRSTIYQNMTKWIRQHHSDVKLYLCMEEKSLCSSCQTFPFTKK